MEMYIFSAILCHYRELTEERRVCGEKFPAMT